MILEARQPQTARAALEQICAIYRAPVLVYLRRHGYALVDAEDLTQDFFARLLERRWDMGLDPSRGRFRSYLLTSLQRFVIDAEAATHARKRGGDWQRVDIDDRPELTLASTAESPEEAFDRAWAQTVLENAYARLREEAIRAGKGDLFDRLRVYLTEPSLPADYRRLGEEVGLRPNTIAVSVHRLRTRLRELVREELAETTRGESDLLEEMRELRSALGGTAH